MKRITSLFLIFSMLLFLFLSCSPEPPKKTQEKKLRLFDFVGVWTEEKETEFYRFTPSGNWYRYNEKGEVEHRGKVTFDGARFSLKDETQSETILTANGKENFTDENGTVFYRTDSPASLILSKNYKHYFDRWYEDGNLNGNLLSVYEPDLWKITTPKGTVLSEGIFYAYAEEEENLYLYDRKNGQFYAMLSPSDQGIVMQRTKENGTYAYTDFCTKENSVEKSCYFREKEIEINYFLGDGLVLLRDGGAAYNDTHDYKKMPVNCSVEMKKDRVEQGIRTVEIDVTYDFLRSEMPDLLGSTVYNSVRFSQYDYYTGELFPLGNSTGTELQSETWTVTHQKETFTLRCSFASLWEFPKNSETVVRFKGTYYLTMPENYDGFVLCLRPVANSYLSQIVAPVTPPKGTLVVEDLGEDLSKSIFCRIEKYRGTVQ